MTRFCWPWPEFPSANFPVDCPDGETRIIRTRQHCGWATSTHPETRRLWWHDMVDWPEVGLGPATWDWRNEAKGRCSFAAPDGHRCALPFGHVGYLGLGHWTEARHRFVVKMRGEWPPLEVAA